MPRPKSWSPRKIAYWKRRYAAGGILHREIAERTGTKTSMVAWYLGGTRKPPKLSSEQVEAIRHLYATVEGITQAELGERFGVVPSWICRAVRGIDPIPRWQPCGPCAQDACDRHKPRGLGLRSTKTYPHGTRARYFMQACRCGPCHDANIAYERNRVRMKLYGLFDGYVDAAPAREHLRRLAEAGVGYKQVAKAAGVPSSNLCRIMGKRGNRGARTGSGGRWKMATYRPMRRVRQSTLEKILAVTISDAMAPGALVSLKDADLARRRVAELVAAGMLKWRIAVHLDPDLWRQVGKGKRPGLQVTRHQRITRKHFDGIAELYVSFFRELRQATPEERRQVVADERARFRARRTGDPELLEAVAQ
jgi:hypothetical protein